MLLENKRVMLACSSVALVMEQFMISWLMNSGNLRDKVKYASRENEFVLLLSANM